MVPGHEVVNFPDSPLLLLLLLLLLLILLSLLLAALLLLLMLTKPPATLSHRFSCPLSVCCLYTDNWSC